MPFLQLRCVLLAAVACSGILACSNASESDATMEPVIPVIDEEQGAAPAKGREGDDESFAPAAAKGDTGAEDAALATSGDTALAEDASSIEDASPIEDAASVEDTARAEDTAPVTDSAPLKKPATIELSGEGARQLAAMKVTAYEHTTFVDEATGTFKYDCSGFLAYALKRSLPTHYAAIKEFSPPPRPLAKDYQLFFAAIAPGNTVGGWSRVTRAIDMRPGDVVAWLKPLDWASSTTGHVVLVSGTPKVNPERGDEILVPVTDSSASFHGAKDTRYPSGQGLGSGTIGLIVDASGAPTGFRWTGGVSTRQYSTAIAIGRPE